MAETTINTRRLRFLRLAALLPAATVFANGPAISQAGADLGRQSPPAATDARIEFDKRAFDWGEVVQGVVVEPTYQFRNIGTEVLRITRVKPG